jgi:hypothetical protein
MRFPAQILQDRYTEQLMKMDLQHVQIPAMTRTHDDEVHQLGLTLQKMFAERVLKRMWIDKDTHEVFCE